VAASTSLRRERDELVLSSGTAPGRSPAKLTNREGCVRLPYGSSGTTEDEEAAG
jgi:hypothetical protein